MCACPRADRCRGSTTRSTPEETTAFRREDRQVVRKDRQGDIRVEVVTPVVVAVDHREWYALGLQIHDVFTSEVFPEKHLGRRVQRSFIVSDFTDAV